jgi:hypothetical protein
MRKLLTAISVTVFLQIVFFSGVLAQRAPIALHPENPHYFNYKNKPLVLISSGEHYGMLMNTEFNYTTYLDALAADHLNLTRVFSGAYAEPQGAFNIASNTLAPAAGKLICPWKRSDVVGYTGGGNKFDLSQWDENYFEKLKQVVSAAEKRGIIVEFTFFCPFYEEVQWKLSPMNMINNINMKDSVNRNNVYTLDKNGGLLEVQESLVRKLVNELKDFSNIIYEICNEPYFGGVTIEWQHHIADVVTETEKSFPKHHLISQNIQNVSQLIVNPHPAVSVFNFHYASPPATVGLNYGLNKVIGDNETGFAGNSDSTYRREGWEFILAGGALYNNLDYSFTVGHEQGNFVYPSSQPGGGSTALRKQLSYLQSFIKKFDFIHMKPDSTIVDGLPNGSRAQVLAESGKQYAMYFCGAKVSEVELNLPKGNYVLEWIDPVNNTVLKNSTLNHTGEKAKLLVPSYKEDIALSIKMN